jgi:AraC-like DNA-binding protein
MTNPKIPLVSKESAEFFASMFKELDLRSYDLLRKATLPSDIHKETNYLCLPESSLKNFMEVLGESLENDRLGIVFLRSCRETFIPKMVGVLTPNQSLKAALEEFCEVLKQESTGAHVCVENSGGKWWLVRHKSKSDEVWFKYAEMFSVMFMAELLRVLTSNRWTPTIIGIQDSSAEDFKKLPTLGKATFSVERPVTALEIPQSLIDLPINLQSVEQSKLLLGQLDLGEEASYVDQFRLAMRPYLSMGKLPITLAAQILRTNVRTLQRKLKKEDRIYQELIEEMVFDEIKECLTSTDFPVTQVASQFGYSDSAHFGRSFKRVTGLTPTQYRAQRA